MVLELVAARLIAKHLGSSLYTWTAVIGVVLAGITIGNYLGGRIADRFPARKALATLFAISSGACVITVIVNNLVGEWVWLWHFSWPARTFTHVSLVFLLPSVLLGTISPVVAKMALDRGFATGRTVGDIYAAGAAGSIAGTFAAGYYLIATMGTIAIIWTIGATLLLIGILYWARCWPLYIWAVLFGSAVVMGMVPADWAKNGGAVLALRDKPDPRILYEDESQYCYIKVQQTSSRPEKRIFMQDRFVHSRITMNNLKDFQHFYMHVYAAITQLVSQKKEKLTTLTIGGGGYVYPRYIEKNYPGSRVDVVEIDPGVTEAAMQAFGLERDTTINSINMDARNYVDELLERKSKGEQIPQYDFIYEDAINDYSVPYQLVTKEFNNKITSILADGGVYMVNLIDIYDTGMLLGSIINTLEQTFSNVYVLSEFAPKKRRNVFIVAAAMQKLDIEKILEQYRRGVDIWYLDDTELDDTEIDMLRQKAGGIVLSDDYVPVENMLAPVVRRSGIEFLVGKYRGQARELKREGKLDEAIAKWRDMVNIDETISVLAFNEIGMIEAQRGDFNEATQAFRQAIRYNEQAQIKINLAAVHLNLALLLKKQLKQPKEAEEHFQEAIEGFKKELAKNPQSIETVIRLASTLVEIEDFKQATEYCQKAVDLNPYDVSNHYALSKVLESQGRYDEAISALRRAIGFMTRLGREEDAAKLKRYLEFAEFRKSKQKK
jgi:tetratricopeptide (TPR) repeat protein